MHWVRLMSSSSDVSEKVAALMSALRVHARRARDAERGRAPDRHLFGLFVAALKTHQKGPQQVLTRMLSMPFELSTHQHLSGRHRSGRPASLLEGGGCCASTKTGYSIVRRKWVSFAFAQFCLYRVLLLVRRRWFFIFIHGKEGSQNAIRFFLLSTWNVHCWTCLISSSEHNATCHQ